MLTDTDLARLCQLSTDTYRRLVLRLFQQGQASADAWAEMADAVAGESEATDSRSTEAIDREILALLDKEP